MKITFCSCKARPVHYVYNLSSVDPTDFRSKNLWGATFKTYSAQNSVQIFSEGVAISQLVSLLSKFAQVRELPSLALDVHCFHSLS